jgi:citrate lyase subunit beta / citryl-CoA lyase
MKRQLPVWRSLLYVPTHVEKFVANAHVRGADCILLDLEDAVPAAEKEVARSRVEAASKSVRRGGADVMVRINRSLALAVRDIESCVGPCVDGFMIAKTESASHVRLLEDHIAEVELRRGLPIGHSKLIVLVESAGAWPELGAIAKASERIVGLSMGGEDFALDCGMEATADTLLLPKQQLVYAASAAGVLPLGLIASITDFGDDAAFRANVQRSKQYGFAGASCIHPRQVPILNEVFCPSPQELSRATRIIAALTAAEQKGLGAVAVDGKMVDAPVARNAERVLARSVAIAAREARQILI